MAAFAAGQIVISKLTEAGLGDVILARGSEAYRARIDSYWSVAAHLSPIAILTPRHTADVIQMIKILVAHRDVPFCMRSGGHIAWGASNMDDGLTIDLQVHMHSVSYDADRDIVAIEPGAKWAEVYHHVEALGIAVAGGRTASVGACGLLTGGGISWYIPRFGFGCDQIVNVEIVLADGRVANANKDEHADLWRALKGGSAGNFGVVTRIDVATVPYSGGIWAGMLISDTTQTDAHIQCMVNYTNSLEQHPESTYIVLWNYEPSTFKDTIITSFGGSTKCVENPPELQELLAIPTIVRDMKKMTLEAFAQSMEQPMGYFDYWMNATVLADARVLKFAVDAHDAVVAELKAASPSGNFSSLCLFQGFPSFYSRLSDARGGNVMGLREKLPPGGSNAVNLLMSVNIHRSEPQLCALGSTLCASMVRDIEDYARGLGLLVEWKYMNYAAETQNPFAEVGAEAAGLIRAAVEKYDPTGVFQRQAHKGFKICERSALAEV